MMTKQAELKKQAYASNLKSRALSVLIYLIDRSNKELTCFPSIPTMAKQLHISISTVKRALHELLDSGYIKKDFRFREKNRGQTSNLYTLVLFEGGVAPNGGDGSDSKDCTEEGGAEEGGQEKANEIFQGKCQAEHISFDTLKRQIEEVKETQKAEEQSPVDAICAEEYPKIQTEDKICGSCTPVQVIKTFWAVWNGNRDFVIIQQHEEKIMQTAFRDRYRKFLLYLWTGEGVSLMPP